MTGTDHAGENRNVTKRGIGCQYHADATGQCAGLARRTHDGIGSNQLERVQIAAPLDWFSVKLATFALVCEAATGFAQRPGTRKGRMTQAYYGN